MKLRMKSKRWYTNLLESGSTGCVCKTIVFGMEIEELVVHVSWPQIIEPYQ